MCIFNIIFFSIKILPISKYRCWIVSASLMGIYIRFMIDKDIRLAGMLVLCNSQIIIGSSFSILFSISFFNKDDNSNIDILICFIFMILLFSY